MARTLDELHVYQAAEALSGEVLAILQRPAFRRNRKLREQIEEAAESIPSNIAEGFGQPTDVAFAHYLFIARGSLNEVVTRMRSARRREWITAAELTSVEDRANSLGKQLSAFIRYLTESNFKDRGRHEPGTSDQGPRDQGTKDQGLRTRD